MRPDNEEADYYDSFETMPVSYTHLVGKLDEFPLIDNEDILVKEDIFRILEESGVGVPAYYNPCLLYTSPTIGTVKWR